FFMEDDKPYIKIDGGDITKKSPVIQSIQNALHTFQEKRGEKLKEDFEKMEDKLTHILEDIQQQTGQSIQVDFHNTNFLMDEPEINYVYLDEDADFFVIIA